MRFVAAAGAALLGAGLFVAPQRAWPSLLLVSYYLLGLGLAGLFFVALHYVTGSGWSTALRRVPEAMTAILPAAALGLAAVFLGRPAMYPWTAEALHGFKGQWLNRPFFLARAAVFLTIWIVFATAIRGISRRQDRDGDVVYTQRNARLSAVFLVLFAITFWLASFDWIMSLEPHWYSTIFGVYSFAGLFQSGLAGIILLSVRLQRQGPLRDFLNEEHLHDLGKLLFAFSTFWMYIWFSQYMLIWYANIPDETTYFIRRTRGAWQPLFLLNIFLNWVAPFVALLPKRTKRSAAALSRVAAVVLVGRWLDLYLMIAPPFTGAAPAVGLWEAASAAAGLGLFVTVFSRAFTQAPPAPLRDPLLAESLHYHN